LLEKIERFSRNCGKKRQKKVESETPLSGKDMKDKSVKPFV
jgi:hypothetical protein